MKRQELADLDGAERQLGRPYVVDAAGRSHPWQGKRRKRPATHAEPRARRQVLQQHGDHPPAGLVGDQVSVVDDDDEGTRRGDALGERRQDTGGDGRRRKLHPVGDHGLKADDAVQDGHQVAEEDEGVVVGVVGLEPRMRPRVGCDPLRQRDRLAEPSRRGDDDEGLRARRQLVDQTVAAYELQQRARRAETGLQWAQGERAPRAIGRCGPHGGGRLRSDPALATRHGDARDRSSRGGPQQDVVYRQATGSGHSPAIGPPSTCRIRPPRQHETHVTSAAEAITRR